MLRERKQLKLGNGRREELGAEFQHGIVKLYIYIYSDDEEDDNNRMGETTFFI